MSCARYPSWRHGATGRAAWFSLALLTAGLGATTDAAATPAHRLLRLQQALEAAQRHQPRLRQARANTDAAAARALQTRAGLLPSVTASGLYQRTTANFAPRPGALPSSAVNLGGGSSFATYNYFNVGLAATLRVYDFGQSWGSYRAAQASAAAQRDSATATAVEVANAVYAAYFAACTQKALVQVAREQLDNETRHLAQVRVFVSVGTRPAIDLAQAQTAVANARVQQVSADNAYAIARAQLDQAMGVVGGGRYDVADDTLPPIAGEDGTVAALLAQARRTRPDLRSLEQTIRAQKQTVRSARGGYFPALDLSTSLTDGGTALDALAWNFNVGASLSWPIFEGGRTRARVREARATERSAAAARDLLAQSIAVELEQALLSIRAAKAIGRAAAEAQESARVQLQLAEGRYQAGVGNIIELGDAQTAYSKARAQTVQARYDLATARAQLLRALGRTR